MQLVVKFLDPFIIKHLQEIFDIGNLKISSLFSKNDVLERFLRGEIAGEMGAPYGIHPD